MLFSSLFPRWQHGFARRTPLAVLLGLLTAAAMLLGPALARADTSSSLTVVGTSDVSDSGLIQYLTGSAAQSAPYTFFDAYPQYKNSFKYIGTGTGAAIADAEAGEASALIVHAASLENQFVAGGYSDEQYGRALFTNDFVLAGPTGDPAGIAAGAPHSIALAFAGVATAGAGGRATFVSRGGTPGTTVEEHKIWALVDSSNLAPSSLVLCAVNSTLGGGDTPIAAGNGVTASNPAQPCPGGGALPSASQLPKWYETTGLTQGPNVVAANACTNHTGCYVLTDRGTFDYLASGTDPAGSIPGLKIVTRDDSATAPGGANELINYFHGYILNPNKVPGVNLAGAQDFLDFLTSPQVQTEIAGYLAHTSDPGGAPFKPDASPVITETGIPRNYHAGRAVTVKGTVTNAEPGYPSLAGVPVTIDEVAGRTLVPIVHGKTDGGGGYKIRFVPPVDASYEVTTGQIAKVEISPPVLSPAFGDLLSPGSSTPTKVTVYSAITRLRVQSIGNHALVFGTDAPGTGQVKARVTVYARPAGSHRAFRKAAQAKVGSDSGNFALDVHLTPGSWQLRVVYSDRGVVKSSRPRTATVLIARPSAFVQTGRLRRRGNRLSITATIQPKRVASGATVRLLALKANVGSPLRFVQIGSARVGSGATTVTVHGRLRGTGLWFCELEVISPGTPPAFSSLSQALVLAHKK